MVSKAALGIPLKNKKRRRRIEREWRGKGEEEVGKMAEAMSDSDAQMLVEETRPSSAPASGRLWETVGAQKRNRGDIDTASHTSEEAKEPPLKVFVDRRAEFLKDAEAKSSRAQTVEAMAKELESSIKELGAPADVPADVLVDHAKKCMTINREVAARSASLKGGYVRSLNLTTKVFGDVVEALASRTSATELKTLQADNARLRNEVNELRKVVDGLREEMARGRETSALPPPSPSPAPHRATSKRQLAVQAQTTVLSQEEFARGIMDYRPLIILKWTL